MKVDSQKFERDKELRQHVLYLLRGGGAHISFDSFVEEFPLELINKKVGNLPYTPWQALEHMRIAQRDILEFSRNPRHISPKFPEGYWPSSVFADENTWQATIKAFRSDLSEMEKLVTDPELDLFTPIPQGEGQTMLREALLVADHNAYHLGSLMVLKKIAT